MNGTPLWFTATCICLLGAGCAQDGGNPSHVHPASAPTHDARLDAGADEESASDAGRGESDADAVRDVVDQTAPSGANGLAFDAEGMIWLADLFGKQVLRLDPTSGQILARFNQNASGPDDVAIDTQGRVFWTDWLSGRVGRIEPTTKKNEIIATLPAGVNSIAFTPAGRLFVGLVILNFGLYELDPEGVHEPRLVTDAIGSLNAFAIGPDGFLWGPFDDSIVRIDLESGEVVETIAQGSYASVRYSERYNAFFGVSNGDDKTPPELDKIDPDDHHVTRFSVPKLAEVDNFEIDSEGEFFVTAFDKPIISVINPDGSLRILLHIGESPDAE